MPVIGTNIHGPSLMGNGGLAWSTNSTVDPDKQYQSALDWGNQRAKRQQDQQQFGANLGFQRDQLAAQQQQARDAQANQMNIARMQADASRYPTQVKESMFNRIFPYIGNLMGGGGGSFLSGYNTSGQVGQQPYISDAPVYSQQNIQENVNAARAQSDAAMASRQQQLRNSSAGRGASANSPLVQSMMNAMYGQNLAANTAAEQQLRFNAAKENASHVLDAQKARESQFGARQQEGIERGKVSYSGLASILGALGSFI